MHQRPMKLNYFCLNRVFLDYLMMKIYWQAMYQYPDKSRLYPNSGPRKIFIPNNKYPKNKKIYFFYFFK